MPRISPAIIAALTLSALVGCAAQPAAEESPAPSSAASTAEATPEPSETSEPEAWMIEPGGLLNPHPVGETVTMDGWEVTFGPVLRDQPGDVFEADEYAPDLIESAEIIAFDTTGVRVAEVGEPSFGLMVLTKHDKTVGEYGSYEYTYSPDAAGTTQMAIGDSFTMRVYAQVMPETADDGNVAVLHNINTNTAVYAQLD